MRKTARYAGKDREPLQKTEIYQNVVAWFRNVTKTNMIEASEVIAAFFVQNCEVLD